MKVTFLGAAHEVTGSCTLLEFNNHKILVDYGMEQGPDTYLNVNMDIDPTEIDCLLLTHAHIDHSGMIPKLVKDGFKGNIYTTYATYELCNIMLRDSAHIQESDAEWKSRKNKRKGLPPVIPPYTLADVDNALPLFVPCNYNEYYDIYNDCCIRFIDAGHLLGSASVMIKYKENNEEKTILFSGDIGNINRPLIRDPQKPNYADYVVIESTYGDRLHDERVDYKTQVVNIIQSTLDRGGNIIIPSFAIGRTQELLYLIRQIKEEKLVKNHDHFQVWVDSPLAVEATSIYNGGLMDYYDDETISLINRGIDILHFDDVKFSKTVEESRMLNEDRTPKIILSASGMCEAGRIRHHLKHNLWNSRNTVLFVGYQAVGTLGRTLLEGKEKIKILGEEVKVNAHIEQMQGISGHADRDMLLDWLNNIKEKPIKVFVNHGDNEVSDKFAELIKEKLGIEAVAPYNGAIYDLSANECIYEGNKELINKNKKKQIVNKASYQALLDADKLLNSVIELNRDGSNYNNKLFAEEIIALANKWKKDVVE